jgi:hypothetical protein
MQLHTQHRKQPMLFRVYQKIFQTISFLPNLPKNIFPNSTSTSILSQGCKKINPTNLNTDKANAKGTYKSLSIETQTSK